MKSQKKSFKEIISMIVSACNAEFYTGSKEVKDIIIECATKIYIEQMKEGDTE